MTAVMRIARSAKRAATVLPKRAVVAGRNFDAEDSVLLCSSARSGSTWLMESILKLAPELLPNWEPLHATKGTAPSHWGWKPGPDVVKEGDVDQLRNVLSMQRTTEWTLSRADLSQCVTARRVLTKTVRANLILPWITDSIALRTRPILLVRHPIAVVHSQLNAFYSDRRDSEFGTDFERLIHAWYSEHHELLKPDHRESTVLAFYESLIAAPDVEIPALLTEAKLDFGGGASVPSDYRRPSSTDVSTAFLVDPAAQVAKTASKSTEWEREVMARFATEFDCHVYQPDVTLPMTVSSSSASQSAATADPSVE